MIGKIVMLGAFVAAVLLFLLLNITTPTTAGPVGILSVFILSYVVILGIMTFFVFLVSRLLVKLGKLLSVRRPIQAIDIRRSYYYASLLALVPPILVAMQSVGRVSFYEVGLVAFFVILGCVYVTKRVT